MKEIRSDPPIMPTVRRCRWSGCVTAHASYLKAGDVSNAARTGDPRGKATEASVRSWSRRGRPQYLLIAEEE